MMMNHVCLAQNNSDSLMIKQNCLLLLTSELTSAKALKLEEEGCRRRGCDATQAN